MEYLLGEGLGQRISYGHKTKGEEHMKDLMEQGHTRILNGREIILAEDKYGRIGWVFKDTGLVPTEDDMEPRKKEKKPRKKEKNI